MTSEEGVFQGASPGSTAGSMGGYSGSASGMNDPAMWPQAAEELKPRGWWPAALAALGSIATLAGAMLFARRRSKRSGLMAAMPSQIVDASEQMMRSRGHNGGGGGLRTIIAVIAFALAGWGIRRKFAQQA